MRVIETQLGDALVLEPKSFGDARGFFLESYSERVMADLGIRQRFVQDNHSFSTHNVLRGLHYQVCHPQGKLIRVVTGEILDVAVDLRRSSPTFGQWCKVRLSAENKQIFWMPPGLAHGFRVLSETSNVLYKATDFYHPECERTVLWNDPDLNIDWELKEPPLISPKDEAGKAFRDAETFE
jgi:dTDP-4-dehydrorhamnose 3,5-epimerase